MRIQILSDTHLEFHQDGGRAFIERLDPSGVDVLVLAGDIDTCTGLYTTLCRLKERYSRIVYVPGNHEYYGNLTRRVDEVKVVVDQTLPDVHWLDCSTVTIDGVRFVGGTLWFKYTDTSFAYRNSLNDFYMIQDFVPWVYERNSAAMTFLNGTVKSSDVVVTHHLPSDRSVPARYRGSPLNAFFVCDMENLISKSQPKLWIHGHTHDSHDYLLGDTRIICNPYGYKGNMLNDGYDNEKIVEI